MKLKVKTEKIDDELLIKRMNMSIGDNSIITPFKSTDISIKDSSVNEIYKEISSTLLDSMLSDETQERRINSDIQRKKGKNVNLFIVNYTDLQSPNDKQMETLSDMQYSHSDVVITPSWSKICRDLTGDALLENYIQATNNFIKVVETLNNKSIVGLISSKLPRQYLEKIIDNYHKQDITSFVIDFDGRSIATNPTWIRSMMRTLSSLNLIEESFIYSINANEGKFMKIADRILAKDFINLGFGIDGLGLNHIGPRISTEIWNQIKAARQENTLRIFDREDYAYTKVPEQEIISQWNVPSNQVRNTVKTYNMKEQKDEALQIQQIMKSNDTVESYLQTKSQIDEDTFKKIKLTRRDALTRQSRQKSLFE
ncbi:MAG: hypothetical protein Q7J68_07185 [Thermoplasmata archaeon]|nr:hypothetical protein [Thermoplasmata archaeon]